MKCSKKMRNIVVVASAIDVVDIDGGMHCAFGVVEFVADALEAMPHSPIGEASKHSDSPPSIFVDIGVAFVDEH